jgi:hypothetical protein
MPPAHRVAQEAGHEGGGARDTNEERADVHNQGIIAHRPRFSRADARKVGPAGGLRAHGQW